jgi:microcystin-dependent protein
MSLTHTPDDLWGIILEMQAKINDLLRKEQTPIGVILAYGGGEAPPGYLMCDGSTVPRNRDASTGYGFPELFGVIGSRFGDGNGTTTFHLPNTHDCFLLGAGSITGAGGNGGEQQHTLINEEMPMHTHSISSDGSHNHTPGAGGNFVTTNAPTSAQVNAPGFSGYTLEAYTSANGAHSHGGATGTGGGDTAHNNMPPYLGVEFIIAAF